MTRTETGDMKHDWQPERGARRQADNDSYRDRRLLRPSASERTTRHHDSLVLTGMLAMRCGGRRYPALDKS